MNRENNLCPMCYEKTEWVDVSKKEEVTLKGDTFQNMHHYMKCENCGEIFEDPKNIDQNYLSDYEVYREKNNLLQPDEIAETREKYVLSQRQFSKILGIGHSTLSRIESGALQSEYQNSLFVLSRSPISFRHLIQTKHSDFNEEKYKELMSTLNQLVEEEVYETNF